MPGAIMPKGDTCRAEALVRRGIEASERVGLEKKPGLLPSGFPFLSGGASRRLK
jgi:hypothetical protein